MMATIIRVLYVDDEPALLEVGKLFLEESGQFSVDIITSAPAALALLDSRTYDSIISDYQMPEMDGIEFLKRVRTSGNTIPFILFTGRGREEIVIQALNEGADFYLQKGGEEKSQFAELAHKIRQAVKRRLAEGLLRESEEFNRSLVENLPDYVIVYGTDGKILYVNPASAVALGYTPEELIGKPVLPYVAEDYRDMVIAKLASRKNSRDIPAYEIAIMRKDGLQRSVIVKGTHIQYRNNTATLLVLTDITERSRAEDALRESEDRYRTLVENANEAILVIQNGRICYANPKLVEIGKYTQEELAQKSFLEFVHPDDRTTVGEQYKRRLAEEILKDNYVFRIVSKEGDVLWMEINASLIIWNGQPADLVLLSDITERKHTENALRESEEKYRTLIEVAFEGILILDLTGTILFGNRAAGRIIDAEFAVEMLGTRNVLEFLAPESLPDAIRDFSHVVQGGDAYLVKYKVITTTGREVWIECMGKKLTFKGSPAILLSLRNVTERQRAEEALRESEERYRTLADTSPSMIYLVDREGYVRFVNPAAAAQWGLSPDELTGKHLREIFPLPIADQHMKRICSVLAQGTNQNFETCEFFPNGERWIDAHLAPMKTEDGNVIGVLGISDDITDRKKVEGALRKSEKKYRGIITKMQDAIYRTDREGRLIMFSPAGVKLAGYDSEEEMIGLNVALDTYQNPQERERFLDILKEKGSVENYPLVLKTRHGILRLVTASSHFYYDDEGNVLGVEGILHDITELRKKGQALREANRKLNLLSGITRHDINNQLTVLQGYLAILEKKQPDPSLSEYFQKAATAAQRISTMIQFTKEYEKIGVNAPVWQDCRTLVDTATKQAPLGTVTMNNDLPAGTEVFADPLIVKVFYNLMDNAVRYGEKITTIRFSAQESGDNYLILCEDDGNGIPEDEKERIFDHDFGKNTGLGLFLAREILNITGITIQETGSPGKGARFEMTVPKEHWRIPANEV